jgi:hypothetical protein
MKTARSLLLVAVASLHGQTSPKDAATAAAAQKSLTDAASKGTPIPATINVSEKVSIEAVMLPWEIARHVFGRVVSKNYTVIAVNISNRSNDAGLIVHSLFIDLHDWGLAGPMSAALTIGGMSRPAQPYEKEGTPLEVSSVEYRIVRGEMLDKQPWTARNTGLRIIQAMGSIGATFAFPFSSDIVKGIGAWNSAVIPGFEALFPDSTQAQMDRVSDYGFRDNKVIPQQSSDILIAFFPIHRFLTPKMKEVFLENPAVFFNPILMAIDPKTRQQLLPFLAAALVPKKDSAQAADIIDTLCKELLKKFSDVQAAVAALTVQYKEDLALVEKAQAALTQAQAVVHQDGDSAASALVAEHSRAVEDAQQKLDNLNQQAGKDKSSLERAWLPLTSLPLYNLLGSLSLNNVHVVVRGIMATDINNVPAALTSITCTNDSQPAAIWGAPGDRACVIHGSFLTDGTPVIAEAATLGITVGAVTTGSTDAALNIKLTLTRPVPAGTVLTFQITKKNKQGNTVESMKLPYTVPEYGPSITSVAAKDTTVTVTGTNFSDTTASPLAVTAHAVVTGRVVADQKIAKPTLTGATGIEFDDKGFASACWQVQVKVGAAAAPASTTKPPKDQFAIAPTPKIDTATLEGVELTLAGSEWYDLTACGGAPLTFEVLSDAEGAKAQAIAKATFSADGAKVTFDMPTLASGAKWKEVHALLGGKQVATAQIKVTSAPSIASVAVKDTTVTVTGTNFVDTVASPLSVAAHAVVPASGVADQKIAKPIVTGATGIEFDDKAFPAACWQVQVKVGTAAAPASTAKPPKDEFATVPTPKISTATLHNAQLTVTGSEFYDLSECGGAPLTFEVLSDAAGAKPKDIAKAALSADGKKVTFNMPALAAEAKWKEVHALLGGKQVATATIRTQ